MWPLLVVPVAEELGDPKVCSKHTAHLALRAASPPLKLAGPAWAQLPSPRTSASACSLAPIGCLEPSGGS